jgi:hypothetical protein
VRLVRAGAVAPVAALLLVAVSDTIDDFLRSRREQLTPGQVSFPRFQLKHE